jgi:hypothetical protein
VEAYQILHFFCDKRSKSFTWPRWLWGLQVLMAKLAAVNNSS